MSLRNFIVHLLFRRGQVNFDDFHTLNTQNYVVYQMTLSSIENYVIYFPWKIKKLIEHIILVMALLSLVVLIFVHINFMQFPSNCVNQIKNNWPRNGVLQVVLHRPNNQVLNTNRENIYYKEFFAKINNPENIDEVNNETIEKFVWEDKCGKNNMSRTNFLSYYISPIMQRNIKCTIHYDKGLFKNTMEKSNLGMVKSHFSQINESVQCFECPNSCINNVMSEANNNLFIQSTKYTTNTTHEQNKAMFYENNFEYSLEEGYLYLSSNSRRQLGIPVMTVLLEHSMHYIYLGSYIDDFVVNYEHFLLSTLEKIASEEGKQGFLRDVITKRIHNIFYKSSKMWYIFSFIMIFVFNLLMSLSVKYMYHQFYFVLLVLSHVNTLEGTILVTILKVVSNQLVLHGIVIIMSYFFSINEKCYYLILLSFFADQYYVVCSRNVLTKKYWLKFFYLYQFAFYAYHSHFGGKYFNLVLICLYLCVLHSMVFFFHNFEMPLIEAHIENMEHDEEERNVEWEPRERDLEDMRQYEQLEEEQQQQFYIENDQQQVVMENDNQSEDDSLVEMIPRSS